jgi:hypothetical protein
MKESVIRLSNGTVLDGDDDLYLKYCRFTEEARQKVIGDYPPGPDRNYLLGIWEPVHRERFEAKLEEFSKVPGKLERVLYLLKLGFEASH